MGLVSPCHTLHRGVTGLICSTHAFRRDAFIRGSSPRPGKEKKTNKHKTPNPNKHR